MLRIPVDASLENGVVIIRNPILDKMIISPKPISTHDEEKSDNSNKDSPKKRKERPSDNNGGEEEDERDDEDGNDYKRFNKEDK